MNSEDETESPICFKRMHPFRVPVGDCHVRFTCLQTAAGSAVYHGSCVIDERDDTTYTNEECRKIHNAR